MNARRGRRRVQHRNDSMIHPSQERRSAPSMRSNANAAGERIGSIENVMIDKPSGRVAYAVMSFGGVLGFGKSRYPLPWDLLEFDPTLDSYVVDLDPDVLEGAPVYEEGRTNWADEAW